MNGTTDNSMQSTQPVTTNSTQVAPPLAPANAANVAQPVTPAANESLPPGVALGADGKVQMLSTGAFKRLKDDAREKGRKEAINDFIAELGFASTDEAKAALQKLKAPANVANPPEPSTQNANNGNGKTNVQPGKSMRAVMRDVQKLRDENEQLRKQMQKEASKRKELQSAIEAREAEMELRTIAVQTGITDVDYALQLLSKHLAGKEPAEWEKFDEGAFFGGLKSSHPYLFREVSRPATTGTGVGTAPASPNPNTVSTNAAQGSQVDAKSMTKEQYDALLRKRGLQLNL